jgi:hypothetical protein
MIDYIPLQKKISSRYMNMKKSGIPQISKSSANLFTKDNLERKTGQELDL